jgi:aldose 1-epimerase
MHVAPGDEVSLTHETDGRRLTVRLGESTPAWYDVTTWTQSDTADFYCIEPWLGLPNAIHHGHGLRHLAPGQSESAVCRIDAGSW